MPKPGKKITTGRILRSVFAEVSLATAFKEEHQPTVPAMLEDECLVSALAV